jgi:hypothetical protein
VRNLVVAGRPIQRSEGISAEPGTPHPIVRAALMAQPAAGGSIGMPATSQLAAAPVAQLRRAPAGHQAATALPLIEAQTPAGVGRQASGRGTAGSADLPHTRPSPGMDATTALQPSPATGAAPAIISRAPAGAGGPATSAIDPALSTASRPAELPSMSAGGMRNEPDIERVTDQVYQRLVRRLASEREQRGW